MFHDMLYTEHLFYVQNLPDWKLLIILGVLVGVLTVIEALLTFPPLVQRRAVEVVAVRLQYCTHLFLYTCTYHK